MLSENPFGERAMSVGTLETDVNHETVRTEIRYRGKDAPWIVLCHGFPGDEKNSDIAIGLSAGGMSTALIHYRGVGGSTGSFSFTGAMYDIRQVLEDIHDRFEPDTDRLALLGYSFGGLFAVNIAKNYGIRRLACVSPVIDLARFHTDIDMAALLEYGSAKVEGDPQEWQLQQYHLLELHDPARKVAYANRPEVKDGNLITRPMVEQLELDSLLVVHGTADKEVDPDHGRMLFEAADCEKEFYLIGDADHRYSNHRHRLASLVTNYFTGLFLGNKDGPI